MAVNTFMAIKNYQRLQTIQFNELLKIILFFTSPFKKVR